MERFTGFTPQTLRFFAQLKRNNNRPWFTAHKTDYLTHVLQPASAFVTAIGPHLSRLAPGMVADPSPGGSIFRIYKDTRFSADKSPYKTHLGIFFWQGPGKKMEQPGFYFELDDQGLRLYYGWYVFPPHLLDAYRHAVADEELGAHLLRIVKKLTQSGLVVGGEHYKRLPAGFPVDPSLFNLIRHNTFYTELNCARPDALFSPGLINYCIRQWKRSLPAHRWMQQMMDISKSA